MKKKIEFLRTGFIAFVLAFSAAHAQRALDPAPIPLSPVASAKHAAPNEAELLAHAHYRSNDGRVVHSPAKSTHDQVPSGASAKCRDGTYSFSQHRRGTCSHHGGVDNWL